MKISNQPGQELHEYMIFRAACERQRYELSPDFFTAALAMGVRMFFGIEVNEAGDLAGDSQNPRAFAAYLSTRGDHV